MNNDLTKNNAPESTQLPREIKNLIERSRSQAAVTVNAALTMLYWQVGQRVNKEILGNDRAEYGKYILHTLSAKLTEEYGRGWSERNLAYMIRLKRGLATAFAHHFEGA